MGTMCGFIDFYLIVFDFYLIVEQFKRTILWIYIHYTCWQEQAECSINHIFALRNIIEQCIKWNAPIVIIFIDFKKAFDSVNRVSHTLWKTLLSYGIHPKITTLVKRFHESFECSVKVNGWLSVLFPMKSSFDRDTKHVPFTLKTHFLFIHMELLTVSSIDKFFTWSVLHTFRILILYNNGKIYTETETRGYCLK
jgi:hypothetical protein